MNKAVLVGINKYPGSPLQGCINDVEDMAKFLVNSCKWNMNDIRLLTDSRATTEKIKEHLFWLMKDLDADSNLFFHYSGHGTQMSMRNYGGKVDSLHDVICPVDFDFTPEHAISDDWFMNEFGPIPEGAVFLWLSDSCHSGDLARSITFCGGPGQVTGFRQYPMPADMRWRLETAKSLGLPVTGFARSVNHLHGVFIGGCKSNQTSADAYINGQSCGAFTCYLLKSLGQNDGLNIGIDQIVSNTRKLLAENGYDQEPQLRGDPHHTSKPWLADV